MKLKNIPKEELELLSYTKIAELYLQENKKTMNTAELFKEVCNLLDLGESEYQKLIADFFQSLTTSKEFILLDNGNWDLKANHIVKVQLEDDDEDEEKEEEIKEGEEDTVIDEEIDSNYDASDDSYVDDGEDLAELTIVGEEELEDE